MKEPLHLHIPSCGELRYRQKIMQDPDTMSYNKGYDLNFEGYDKTTGCIAFPEREWAGWHAGFIGREPRCFYAYIVREADGEFIGEVNVHRNTDAGWYEMGIVLEAKYRGKGYAVDALRLLLQHAFEEMDADAVHNEFEVERSAAVKTHLSAGFTKHRQENGVVEVLITREQYFRQKAIRGMTSAISGILTDNQPSVYLYGSSVLEDFRLGWSDIDILVLTRKRISQPQAKELVTLRQRLSKEEPDNPYYCLFEGGMLTLSAFLSKEADCVVYWGTSGQRITDNYHFDSFCMAELLQSGHLLCGTDLRSQLAMPVYDDFYADVKKHYEGIRQYAQKTDGSIYSFGWLLDIARGIYTLRSGAVISKTSAAQWALDNHLCPVPDALEMALKVRRNPMEYHSNPKLLDYAGTLGPEIQRFADVLGKELDLIRESRYCEFSDDNMNRKEMIIFIGIQASGKTTFYHEQFAQHAHISLDVLHTRNKERIAMEECFALGKSMVIDNTNPTVADRSGYISRAKENGYSVIGYFFRSRISDCVERNEKREGKAKVPRTAIAATSNKLEMPGYAEGFDKLYYVYMENGRMIVEDWKEGEVF